jgi:hypothetical protein
MLRAVTGEENTMTKKPVVVELIPIRDLADFHLRWSEFRDAALKASQSPALVLRERETILWLIHMADRIGARDLTRE